MQNHVNPGDRIRLVSLVVTDADRNDHKVNLRFGWTGPDPVHSCHADMCDSCDGAIHRILRNRLGGEVTIDSMLVLRDGQTTAREPANRKASAK